MLDNDQPMFIKDGNLTFSTFLSKPTIKDPDLIKQVKEEQMIRQKLEDFKKNGLPPLQSVSDKEIITDYSAEEKKILKEAEEVKERALLKANTDMNTQFFMSLFSKFKEEPNNHVEIKIDGKPFETYLGPEDIVSQIIKSFDNKTPELIDVEATALSHLVHKAIERPLNPDQEPQLDWIQFIVPVERTLAQHTIENMEKAGSFPFPHSVSNAKYIQAKKMLEITSSDGGKNPAFEYTNYHSKRLEETIRKPNVIQLGNTIPGFKNRAEIAVSRWSDLSSQAQKTPSS